MDFSFSEEQEMLKTMARDFLTKECTKTRVRELEKDEKGYDPQMWKQMAELGWPGLVLPEEYEGTNATFLDLTILMEEMGRNILPSPFFTTVALCALPILEFGSKEQKTKYLPEIARGNAIWTLALTETSATWEGADIQTQAKQKGEYYTIEGTKLFVSYAHVANYLLVIARTAKEANPENGLTAFLVDAKTPGVKVEVIPTIAKDKQCQVTLNKVNVPKNNILGKSGAALDIIRFILQRAGILKCAEILGACQAVMEMTNNYAKERVQFDKPIGSFQAIQHKLADMLIAVEGLQYLVYQAAWETSVGAPSDMHISVTKAKANEVFEHVCIEGVKTHGAIGFTEDHDIGLFYRRVKASQFAMGSTDFHREKVAVELGL